MSMKFPLRVEYIAGANRTTGEPAWKVSDATGWPVCLCWHEDYAKRIAEAMNDGEDPAPGVTVTMTVAPPSA